MPETTLSEIRKQINLPANNNSLDDKKIPEWFAIRGFLLHKVNYLKILLLFKFGNTSIEEFNKGVNIQIVSSRLYQQFAV